MSASGKSTRIPKEPMSIVCEEDPQEKSFERFIRLWVNNEISYSQLMKNYPIHEASMLKKVLHLIVEKIN